MMPRLHAVALSAVLLLPGVARSQAAAKGEAAPPATELDPKTKAAIQKEIDKAKDDIRNEVRAEIQGAQSAAEFMGAVAEGPKLQFLELNGYLRLRGQLFDRLDLGVGPDSSGYTLFPTPLSNPTRGGTLASANMRLRLEPTMNVSEHVRVRAQVDVLDNYVLGSSTSSLFDGVGSPYPVPFYGSSRSSLVGPQQDRQAIIPKRVWGEVQTPVGLLSFGRMPSQWGVGILTHAGQGLDDDYGDTFDRIQFALPPVTTPIGALNIVPILDFDAEGVLHLDPRFGAGVGQPFDAEPGDDARTFAIKIARLDTEDEIRRKLERNERSVNFGAYYNYRTQRNTYPEWATSGLDAAQYSQLHRSAYAHILDLWARWLSGKWRVEAEAVGVYGNVGSVYNPLTATAANPDTGAPASPGTLMRVLLRQWGGTLLTEYKAMPNKLTLGVELGVASGDDAPGFGNVPGRVAGSGTPADPYRLNYGAVEGPQFGRPGDHSIRNFRFNPGYAVDLVLWRRILGQVTDAWYAKPKLRWDILPGLAFDAALVYSSAIYAQSTPSSGSAVDPVTGEIAPNSPLTIRGKKPLGVEADGKLTLTTGDGFVLWGETGVFQPFGGGLGSSPSRGWVLDFGFAAKF